MADRADANGSTADSNCRAGCEVVGCVCNLFAATLGITLSPVIGGVLADSFGLMVPVTLAGLVWLVVYAKMLPIPETAPRILARREAAPAGSQKAVAS